MSVRTSILAVLTLGAAYGLQLHSEIESRTARHGDINVGQIYSTLSRLAAARLVTSQGTTVDGLALYALTARGRSAAEAWLCEPIVAPGGEGFDAMIEHVLLAGSLPGRDVTGLVAAYRLHWSRLAAAGVAPERALREGALPEGVEPEGAAADVAPGDPSSLRRTSDALLATAALGWLDRLDDHPLTASEYSPVRPKRGRRPSDTP